MKVSIYCLVYNHEKYLRDCLEGFISQKTDFEYEVWIHDDASTDGSREIIKEYVKRYPALFKTIFQKDNQYSKVGAKIIDKYLYPRMSGEYFAVCEGDDYWIDEKKLQLQVDFLDTHKDYTACVHNTKRKNMRTGVAEVMYSPKQDEDVSFTETLKRGSATYHTSSLMFRREYAFRKPDFFEEAKGFGDYPMAIYLTGVGKVRFINRVMSVYRWGTESSWTHINTVNPQNQVKFCENVSKMLRKVNSYYDFKYSEEISGIILFHEYGALEGRFKFAELRKGPYRNIYFQKPLKYRVKTYIKEWFKSLYFIYRRLKYR